MTVAIPSGIFQQSQAHTYCQEYPGMAAVPPWGMPPLAETLQLNRRRAHIIDTGMV